MTHLPESQVCLEQDSEEMESWRSDTLEYQVLAVIKKHVDIMFRSILGELGLTDIADLGGSGPNQRPLMGDDENQEESEDASLHRRKKRKGKGKMYGKNCKRLGGSHK